MYGCLLARSTSSAPRLRIRVRDGSSVWLRVGWLVCVSCGSWASRLTIALARGVSAAVRAPLRPAWLAGVAWDVPTRCLFLSRN
jgi:hypothetical protein